MEFTFHRWQRFQKLKEIEKDLKSDMESRIGKKADEMIYLDLLAVSPSYQGVGYGRLVMDAVNQKVSGFSLSKDWFRNLVMHRRRTMGNRCTSFATNWMFLSIHGEVTSQSVAGHWSKWLRVMARNQSISILWVISSKTRNRRLWLTGAL